MRAMTAAWLNPRAMAGMTRYRSVLSGSSAIDAYPAAGSH